MKLSGSAYKLTQICANICPFDVVVSSCICMAVAEQAQASLHSFAWLLRVIASRKEAACNQITSHLLFTVTATAAPTERPQLLQQFISLRTFRVCVCVCVPMPMCTGFLCRIKNSISFFPFFHMKAILSPCLSCTRLQRTTARTTGARTFQLSSLRTSHSLSIRDTHLHPICSRRSTTRDASHRLTLPCSLIYSVARVREQGIPYHFSIQRMP